MPDKSVDDIANSIIKKVNLMIQDEVPLPDCPLKKQQAEWKREKVKKRVGNKLSPVNGAMEIKVSVE